MATKSVVLLSGGVDSSTCLGLAVQEYGKENVRALGIHYGQRHSVEQDAAENIAKYYGVTLDHIDIANVMRFSHCSLMAGRADLPPQKSYADQIAENGNGRVTTYVPYRNGTLLSVAAAYADSVFPGEEVVISYGAHDDDSAGDAYADCSKEFIAAQAEAIRIGTYGNITLEAPFSGKNKSGVVAMGLALDIPVPYYLTHSCYNGVLDNSCNCGTCQDRRAAFHKNGLDDFGRIVD